jgi:hypothetical protein
VILVSSVVDDDTGAWLRDAAKRAEARRVHQGVISRGRYVVTASSFSLEAVLDDAGIDRLLGAIDGALRPVVTAKLGERSVLDVEQSWVRRQYPHAQAPPFHAPHAWHQDGALGHDFASGAGEAGGLLEMVTAWIALTPCGDDAPGLELVDEPLAELLPVVALTDEAVRRRFAAGSFRHPVMRPGDAVVFSGGTLHRTHVTAEMHHERLSVELRWFPSERVPARLQADRFVAWPIEVLPGAARTDSVAIGGFATLPVRRKARG